MTTTTKRVYTDEFKQETVALVTEQDYSIVEAARAVLNGNGLADRLYHSRLAVIDDVNQYMKYYNQARLHSTIDDMPPVQYEKCS